MWCLSLIRQCVLVLVPPQIVPWLLSLNTTRLPLRYMCLHRLQRLARISCATPTNPGMAVRLMWLVSSVHVLLPRLMCMLPFQETDTFDHLHCLPVIRCRLRFSRIHVHVQYNLFLLLLLLPMQQLSPFSKR